MNYPLKQYHLSAALLAAAALAGSGCASAPSSASVGPDGKVLTRDDYEYVKVTGSHQLMRVPKDKSIRTAERPVHAVYSLNAVELEEIQRDSRIRPASP